MCVEHPDDLGAFIVDDSLGYFVIQDWNGLFFGPFALVDLFRKPQSVASASLGCALR